MSAATKFRDELIATAAKVASPGKGILAADESLGTIGKRFTPINVENNQENRRAYRHLLFTAPELEKYVSGVITFEETLLDTTPAGDAPLVQSLLDRGIVVGIKVDKGVVPIPGCGDETVTQGIDGLAARCAGYYAKGARFAKWRGVLRIGEGMPSDRSIQANTDVLARYAAICQSEGLVPIVEPEILMDGTHDLKTAVSVAERVLAAQFKALHDHGVLLEGALLKPAMVLPGKESGVEYTPADVAKATLTAFLRTVPAALPGINFLSGGQSEEEATVNLNAINAIDMPRPWNVSFSYGRALQASCLKAWLGKAENVAAAQDVLIARCKANSEAQLGKYAGGAAGSSESLFVSNYSY